MNALVTLWWQLVSAIGLRSTFLDRVELPDQVVRVRHARIEAHATSRRKAMGRVARKEHPTLTKSLSDLRRHVPGANAHHVHLDLVGPNRAMQDLNDTLTLLVIDFLARRVIGIHEDPFPIEVVGNQGSSHLGIHDEVEDA